MPATASSPLTRPANFVVGSSTTAITSRGIVAGPPSAEGKSRRARAPIAPASRDESETVRCPRVEVVRRRRMSARGTFASRCAGTIGSSARTGGKPGGGVEKRMRTVESSTLGLVTDRELAVAWEAGRAVTRRSRS
jgi:hypothetical protein